jgi:predicted SnoaL-like aldol condensation-catalyzing enzyme
MSTEQNKAVVRRFIEQILNNMDIAQVDEIFAADYANHMVPGGREGFKQFIAMMRTAYPDLKWNFDIKRMLAEGDAVMIRATAHYSNAGKEATGEGWGEYRVVNGKIVEDWPLSGAAELLPQVGVTLPG